MTNPEQYDPNSINAVLARIEQRQYDNGEKLDTTIQTLAEVSKKHEERITSLEGTRKYGLGIIAGVSVGFNGLVEGVKHLINK